MISGRAARRQAIAYALLVAASVVLLAVSSSAPLLELRRGVGFAMAPLQDVLRQGARGVGSFFVAIAELDELRRQNEELQARLQLLEVTNQQLESLRSQNEQLTELLAVRSALDYDTVAAEVISRTAAANERGFSLDRGTGVGIAVDDPVVAGGGALVGRVVEVGQNYSRVFLISDTRMHVIGLTDTSRAEGEIEGQLEQPLAMKRILATESVAVGEKVVTAGIDLGEGIRSAYPKGLLIGTVIDIQRSPDQLFQTALLQPAATLDHLEYVLVITDFASAPPVDTSSPAPSDSAGTPPPAP
jgi:rod shape-determining protein MreC